MQKQHRAGEPINEKSSADEYDESGHRGFNIPSSMPVAYEERDASGPVEANQPVRPHLMRSRRE